MLHTVQNTWDRWKTYILRAVFWLWAPALVVAVASLMVGHWVALPTPEASDRQLAAAIEASRAPKDPQHWRSLHVLYTECTCSRRILEHLLEGNRPKSVAETVVLVGYDVGLESRIIEQGFSLETVSQEELMQKYNIEAAPLLVVADPMGHVRYVGGYTGRKQGLAVQDTRIIAQLMSGARVQQLPAYGCGVSLALQETLDPLQIKY